MVISAQIVNQLRENARELRPVRLPDGLPTGWSISPSDPAVLLRAFSRLSLRPGLALRAYQFRRAYDGHTLVLALPAGTALKSVRATAERPPANPAALPHVLDAIQGDGSPEATLQASIFLRELSEFNAFGHGRNWSFYHVLGEDAWSTPEGEISPYQPTPTGHPQDWNWSAPQPADLRPQVIAEGGQTRVILYLYTALGQQTILQSTDTFTGDSCAFETELKQIANHGGGYKV